MASSWIPCESNKKQSDCEFSALRQSENNTETRTTLVEDLKDSDDVEENIYSDRTCGSICTENDKPSESNQNTSCLSKESELNLLRKSEREKKGKRSYSPDCLNAQDKGYAKKKAKKAPRKTSPSKTSPVRPYDKGPDGEPFACDLCNSRYVCNPSRKGNQARRSKHQPSPRYKEDAETGKLLVLCNACGLSFDRPRRVKKQKMQPTQEEKDKYFDEAKNFSLSLIEELNDPDAEKLWCPYFKTKSCGCVQRYIIGSGEAAGSEQRARHLLTLIKEAKHLSTLKCYNIEEAKRNAAKNKRTRNIGLGNGQKRSKEFEDFVMKNRKDLRQNLKLCERGTQRILMYSNNFLHKRLRTEERSYRAERVKGKAALGLLTAIADLPKNKCCVDNCVMMALTHGLLLQQWRTRAVSGQVEARRVLAEMLTPSGGARSNCYRFISLVTGCSHSTISRVNEQMRVTGGDREPPQHGLKKYWQNMAKKDLEQGLKDKSQSQCSVDKEASPEVAASEESTEVTLQHIDNSKMEMASNPSKQTSTSGDITLQQESTDQTEVVTIVQADPEILPQEIHITTNASEGSSQDYQCVLDISSLQTLLHKQQLLQIHGQLHQQQLQIQQQQSLIQQYLMHQLMSEQTTSPAASVIQGNMQQVLNGLMEQQMSVQQQQQVVQQMQQQQLTQSELQLRSVQQTQVPQVQHISIIETTQPQVAGSETHQLCHDVSQDKQADKSNHGHRHEVDRGNTADILDKSNKDVPDPSSNINLNSVSTADQTVVQQLLELPHHQLPGGSTILSSGSSALPQQTTNLFAQLSDYNSMIAPNVNIATVHASEHQSSPRRNTTLTAPGMESDSDSQSTNESSANPTHILHVQNVGTLHIPASMLNQPGHHQITTTANGQNIQVTLADPSIEGQNVLRVQHQGESADVIIEGGSQQRLIGRNGVGVVIDSGEGVTADEATSLPAEVLRLLSQHQQEITLSTVHKSS